jgi:hypothetical protein
MLRHVPGISCIRPVAPARLTNGRPSAKARPPLSSRITRRIQAVGISKREDASRV